MKLVLPVNNGKSCERLVHYNLNEEKNMNKSKVFNRIFVVLLVLSLAMAGCNKKPDDPELILATTTSTQDSGLLDVLIPLFEEQSGYTVKVVAVGSGEAMKMGQEGNADVLLVHSPASEEQFMTDGYGSDRRLVMHNDFIIVGPAADPAGIRGITSAVEAFTQIANSASPFITRGDDSGTHKKELAIWKSANITPGGDWYVESGQGMGPTLRIASETGAYTLTDRATFLANESTLSLEILVEGDAALLNIYHVIVVNPELWPLVNNAGAIAFADFITSVDTQNVIGEFGVQDYGQALFIPDAGKNESDLTTP
jgi:tungstate transport system substrate-binding protein